MPEQAFITKSKAEQTSMNYEELRELGISQIQELAAETWTDHNLHDPGITILELLSYAITDLGHRTNYAMRDILAENFDKDAPLAHADYSIHRILTCNPLTVNDWRKLFIDLPTVKNAWVRMTSPKTPALYNHFPEDTDNNEGTLTFSDTPAVGMEQQELHLKGFYEVYLQLENRKKVGDPNSPFLSRSLEVEQNGELKNHLITFGFPRWSQLPRIWYTNLEMTAITVDTFEEAPEQGDYAATLIVDTDQGQLDAIDVSIYVYPALADTDDETVLTTAINDTLVNLDPDSLLATFHQKVQTTAETIEAIKQHSLAHRNVCEDFLKVDLICYQEIVLNGDVILQQGADPNEVAAVICFLVDQFLSPLIRFRTLEEMKNLGATIDDLFQGPLLKNGFLHEEDFGGPLVVGEDLDDPDIRALVRNAQGSTNDDELIIYTSDLIRIIMCIRKSLGIIAVRNFSISSFLDKVLQVEKAKDCILLKDAYRCKPKLGVANTITALQFKTESLTVVGESETLATDLATIQSRLAELQETLRQDLTEPQIAEITAQLTPPKGRARNIENYYSLQGDFPLTYGIGRSGLPPTVPDARRAKARQLKAYLLFFEQFLANYQAQLGHVKELFSIDRRVQQTYFSQDLYNVPDAYLLLKNFVDDHQSNIDTYALVATDWTDFKANLTNYYVKKIQQWSENPEVYLDRRNRFLNFLLARFGEDFNDYSALRYFVDQNSIEQSLIACKIDILEALPLISRDRARAFNYCARGETDQSAAWLAYEQSGYKLRLSKLLGLKDPAEIYQEKDVDGIDEFRFRIKNSNGDILLSGSQNYTPDELDLLHEHIRSVKVLATDQSNYELKTTVGGKFYFNIIDPGGDVLARRIQYFDTQAERTLAINEVIAFFTTVYRFHYIEHLLLRPQSDSDPLLQTKAVQLTAIKDPYSFGLSLIFPAWMTPFDNLLYRSYAEKIIYLETPAHLLGEIYWVETEQAFTDFETAYKNWIELRALPTPIDPTDFANWTTDIRQALTTLITTLDIIRTA